MSKRLPDGRQRQPGRIADAGLILEGRRYFSRLPLWAVRARLDRDEPMHGHDFLELVVVVRGSAVHEVHKRGGVDRQRLVAGDVFLLAPGERHGYREPDGLELYNILFTPELLAQDLAHLRTIPGLADWIVVEPLFRRESAAIPRWRLPPGQRRRIWAECDAVIAELDQRLAGWESAARAAFIVLLVRLLRALGDVRRDPVLAAAQEDAVGAAITFIERQYGEELSLADLARRACLSPHHFSAIFRRSTGVPPWRYLSAVRIEHAKRLLADSEMSITAIAVAVGFADSAYFARAFRRSEGTTPRAWREARLTG